MINKMTIVEKLRKNPILHYLTEGVPSVTLSVTTNYEMVG